MGIGSLDNPYVETHLIAGVLVNVHWKNKEPPEIVPVPGTWEASVSCITIGGSPWLDMFCGFDLTVTGAVVGASAPSQLGGLNVWPAAPGNYAVSASVSATLTALHIPGRRDKPASAQMRIIHALSGDVIAESETGETTGPGEAGGVSLFVDAPVYVTSALPLFGHQIRVQARGLGTQDGNLRSIGKLFIGTAAPA